MVEGSTDSLEAPEENDRESSIISKTSSESSASLIYGHTVNAVHHRASIGSENAGSRSMRNSTEKPHSTKIRDNVVSRYLRRSAGSCHDLCKHGRKDQSEEEAKLRLLIPPKNVKVLSNELVPGEKRKGQVVNDEPSTQTRRHAHPPEPYADTRSYSAKHKTSLEKAKVVVKNKPSEDVKNLSGDLQSLNAKPYQGTTRTSLHAKTASYRQSITRLTKQKPSSTKNLPSPEPAEIIKSVCFPVEKVEAPGRKGSFLTASKIQGSEKKISFPAKQPYSSLKLNPVKVRPSLSSEKPDAGGKEQRNNDAGAGKHLAAFQASSKKILFPKLSLVEIPPPIKSRKDGSLKLVSPLKHQNRVRRVKTSTTSDEKVSEKTLHVIKTETDNNVTESIPNDHDILPLSSLPAEALYDAKVSSLASNKKGGERFGNTDVETENFVSVCHKSREIVSIPHPEENHRKTLRKSRVAVSEVKHGSPEKLKFKTGKIMDLKSENYSQRKLRFRRGRVLAAEDGEASLGRTFRKGGTNDNAPSADISSEKVILKHQDKQDKKDAQGLFNNVIKETASKLVESRKSKVKALVGAFETVISLQDSKPSTSSDMH